MITVEFKDFEDMVTFAEHLIGRVKTVAAPSGQALKEVSVPATQPGIQQAVVAPAQLIVQPEAIQQPVQQPVQPVPTQIVQQPVVVPQTVQTTAQTYTIDDLAKAAMPIMDAGRQSELVQLLANFGVDRLPSLSPSQYGAFATALRGLGAQI